MLEDYLELRQNVDSSTVIPNIETHNLIGTKISDIGALQISSMSSNNDHMYDGIIKCNYINDITFRYMDNDLSLSTYKREPIKAYTGHPEYFGNLLSNVTCYFNKNKSLYEYILDEYLTTDRSFTHNVIPNRSNVILESNNIKLYFEVMVDSYSNGTVIIFKEGDTLTLRKYLGGELYKEYLVTYHNLSIKKFDKRSDLVMYHCSTSTGDIVIMLDISNVFRYDIYTLDPRVTNISFIKVHNHTDDYKIPLISVDSDNVYKLGFNCEIMDIKNYREYSSAILDYDSETEIISDLELHNIWVKTKNKAYYIKYIDYNDIPISGVRTQAVVTDKKKGKFYFVMGSDSSSNSFIDYYSYCNKSMVTLKTLNSGGYSSKTIPFSSSNEIKSMSVFNVSSPSYFSPYTKNVRPYHYKYSNMYNYRGVPDYSDIYTNINKMSRNVEYATRMTTTTVEYTSGSTNLPLIKHGSSVNGLFKVSTLKTLYINNCKLK